ncbi:MAG: ParB/RepB/Spo0J family partition protein [Planctomycetaceae bacterium]|nr:ParB/RepB/Spo0J family partition protein [Planctomycetaceae bacterium]
MSREKRLGRGLEALLGKVAAQAQMDADTTPQDKASGIGFQEEASGFGLQTSDSARDIIPEVRSPKSEALNGVMPKLPERTVDVLLIDKNPYQPRLEFDQAEIQSLADSLQTHGLLQPLVVRRHGDRYQLVAGERRLRAALKAGWRDVPVHVLDVDDRQMSELALTENLQRRDLNAIEKAIAFQRYLDTYGGTHEELAKRLELDRSTVTNFLRLLDLPEQVRNMLQTGEITQGHAKAILPLEEWEQIEASLHIRDEGWSVRQTEQYVRDSQDGVREGEDWNVVAMPKSKSPKTQDDHTASLEQEFRSTLGSKVKLTHNNRGKGKLVITFASHDEFDRIYQLICQPKKARMRETG